MGTTGTTGMSKAPLAEVEVVPSAEALQHAEVPPARVWENCHRCALTLHIKQYVNTSLLAWTAEMHRSAVLTPSLHNSSWRVVSVECRGFYVSWRLLGGHPSSWWFNDLPPQHQRAYRHHLASWPWFTSVLFCCQLGVFETLTFIVLLDSILLRHCQFDYEGRGQALGFLWQSQQGNRHWSRSTCIFQSHARPSSRGCIMGAWSLLDKCYWRCRSRGWSR